MPPRRQRKQQRKFHRGIRKMQMASIPRGMRLLKQHNFKQVYFPASMNIVNGSYDSTRGQYFGPTAGVIDATAQLVFKDLPQWNHMQHYLMLTGLIK